jgi:hypothetical protein
MELLLFRDWNGKTDAVLLCNDHCPPSSMTSLPPLRWGVA